MRDLETWHLLWYVLRTAFMHVDPECAKKTFKSAVSFGAFGTYKRKSCM